MRDVITTLVALLTDERYQNKLVVILAGYSVQLEQLMTANAGLARRFTTLVHFKDFTAEDTAEVLRRTLASEDFGALPLTEDADKALPVLAQMLVDHPSFSNGGTGA